MNLSLTPVQLSLLVLLLVQLKGSNGVGIGTNLAFTALAGGVDMFGAPLLDKVPVPQTLKDVLIAQLPHFLALVMDEIKDTDAGKDLSVFDHIITILPVGILFIKLKGKSSGSLRMM